MLGVEVMKAAVPVSSLGNICGHGLGGSGGGWVLTEGHGRRDTRSKQEKNVLFSVCEIFLSHDSGHMSRRLTEISCLSVLVKFGQNTVY